MKKILLYTLTAVAVMGAAPSCVHDERDIFDESSSARMSQTLDQTQQVLEASVDGWVLDMFPNGFGGAFGAQNMGGYAYFVKFADGQVTAWSEFFDTPSTSLYSLKSDNGPVLSFDTFNTVLHYLSTPSGSSVNMYGESGMYQSYKGDYEFTVMSATPDLVVLKGKRTGNYVKMYPATMDADAYLAAVSQIADQMVASVYDGSVGGSDVSAVVDLDNRQMTFTVGEESVKTAYVYTDTGIRLYDTVVLSGTSIGSLVWDNTQRTLSSGTDVLQGSMPDDWREFNDFIGKWTLSYNGRTLPVEIKENVHGKSFLLSGVGRTYDLVLGYDRSAGTISLNAQVVGTEPDDGFYYQLAVWACAEGKVNYTSTNGMIGAWEIGSDPMKVIFSDNRKWLSYSVTGFIVYKFNLSSNSRVGAASGDWAFLTGNHQLPYLDSMTKQ